MIVDSHVHLFPDRVYAALWRWFDKHAWNIRYRMTAEQVVQFLVERGIEKIVALHYSHVPGMARELNRFVAEVARAHREVIPLGTVLPGEPDEREVIDEALRLGVRGFKIHCHVQKLASDDPRLDPLYGRAAEAGVPVVIHAGNAPATSGYGVDPRTLCSAAATRRALERHPKLTLVIPHLGADEIDAHLDLLDQFPNLLLDTTMMLAGYFESPLPIEKLARHADRILYGTDFPNLPYEWDRELRWIDSQALGPVERAAILGGNALELFT